MGMAGEQTPTAPADDQLKTLHISPERKLPKRSRAAGFFLLLAGVVIGLAIALGLPKPEKPAAVSAAEAEATATPEAEEPARKGDVILTATGYVTPRRRIALSPQVMGQVVWVGIEKGQQVEKDQVLVRLNDDEYKARLEQMEAQAAAAKARLEMLEAGARKEDIDRARANVAELEALLVQANQTLDRIMVTVNELGAESRQRLDEAQGNRDATQARLDAAKADLARWLAGERKEEIEAARAQYRAAAAAAEVARIQMDDTIIKAPSAGTILEKLIEVGELVSPQNFGGTRGARTELLSLADLSDLQVEVDINESDFQKLTPSTPARVYLDAYPDRAYEAAIREIAPEADRQKATIQFKVTIKSPDEFVRPEMSARVDFLAAK